MTGFVRRLTAVRPASAPADDEPARLIRLIGAGDEQALGDFYRAFEARVYAFAIRRLNDPHEAADVLNEVMLEVWRGASGFRGRSSVLTWVLAIAHHKVCDRFRRRGVHELEELGEGIADESRPTALETLEGGETRERLGRCLERLSDAHRQVIHLAFYEDLTCAEIARIIDRPEGTVKTRIFHAKRLLKRCLAGDLPEEAP